MNHTPTKRTRRRAPALAIAAAIMLVAVACQAQRNQQDVYTFYASGLPFSMQINEADVPMGLEQDGYEHIRDDVQETCVDALNEDEDEGTTGSWGTTGSSTNATQSNDSNPATIEHNYLTSLGTVPSEDTVNCFMAEVLDDPEDEDDPESLVCDDAGTDPDCQDPDGGGTGTYKILADESAFYQEALAETYSEAEYTLVLVRDYFSETITDPIGGSPGAPGCIAARIDSAWLADKPSNRGNLEWRRVCQ